VEYVHAREGFDGLANLEGKSCADIDIVGDSGKVTVREERNRCALYCILHCILHYCNMHSILHCILHCNPHYILHCNPHCILHCNTHLELAHADRALLHLLFLHVLFVGADGQAAKGWREKVQGVQDMGTGVVMAVAVAAVSRVEQDV
jgi:hypothetical protein